MKQNKQQKQQKQNKTKQKKTWGSNQTQIIYDESEWQNQSPKLI